MSCARFRAVLGRDFEVLLGIELLPVEDVELREPRVVGDVVAQRLIRLQHLEQDAHLAKELFELVSEVVVGVHEQESLHQARMTCITDNAGEQRKQRSYPLREPFAQRGERIRDVAQFALVEVERVLSFSNMPK